MPVIKLKRSETGSSVPTTSDLAVGEVALNTVDQKIYVRDSSNNIITVANYSTGSGASIALNDLSDVSTANVSAGQVLTAQAGSPTTYAFETPATAVDDSFINAIIFG
jgi:hypothetical protein